jgi:hypothetical protein
VFNPALVPWGLCDPSPLWLTFFFFFFMNTGITFHFFFRSAFLPMSRKFARFCVFPFISYLYLFPLGDKRTPLYLPCSIDNCKMQKSQYVYLLLYIRKFLRQSRAYCPYLSTNLCCEILFGEKNIVINCVYILVFFKQWGHIDPMVLLT